MRHGTTRTRQTLAASLLDASSTLYQIGRLVGGDRPTEIVLRLVRHGPLVSVIGNGRIDGAVVIAASSVGSPDRPRAIVWHDEVGPRPAPFAAPFAAPFDPAPRDIDLRHFTPNQFDPSHREDPTCEPPRPFSAQASSAACPPASGPARSPRSSRRRCSSR